MEDLIDTLTTTDIPVQSDGADINALIAEIAAQEAAENGGSQQTPQVVADTTQNTDAEGKGEESKVAEFDIDDIEAPKNSFEDYNAVLEELGIGKASDPTELKEKIEEFLESKLREATNNPLQQYMRLSQLTDNELLYYEFKTSDATAHYDDEKIEQEIELLSEAKRKEKAESMRSKISSKIEQIRQDDKEQVKKQNQQRLDSYKKIEESLKVYKDPDTGEALSQNVQAYISQEIKSGNINKFFRENPDALISAIVRTHPKMATKFKSRLEESILIKKQSDEIKAKAPKTNTLAPSVFTEKEKEGFIEQYRIIR